MAYRSREAAVGREAVMGKEALEDTEASDDSRFSGSDSKVPEGRMVHKEDKDSHS